MAFNGNAATGATLFSKCNHCHVDQKDGTFKAGLAAFDVNRLVYPQAGKYTADSPANLADFILNNMTTSKGVGCNASCANDIAAYLWTYKKAVAVTPLNFDDSGLNVSLTCFEKQSDLNIRITDPAKLIAPYNTIVSCATANAGIQVPPSMVQGANQLVLEVFQDNNLVSQKIIERSIAPTTSCANQGLLKTQVRRLSQTQIKNALNDTFGKLFTDNVWPDMEDGAKLIGMNTMADKLNINSINFDRLYEASRAIVTTLLAKNATIKSCAASTTNACVNTVTLTYAPQLWRRPLTDDELAGLTTGITASRNNSEALEFVFNSLILSSNFLFRTELGDAAKGVSQLNNYEIVSLLSFSVWNSTPDKTLLTLAAKTSPITQAELLVQLERMLNDPRANAAAMEIYKDFLKLDLVLTREKAPTYQFTDSVRQQLLTSAELMLLDNIKPQTPFLEVLGGDRFYVNNVIASFFNTTSTSTPLIAMPLNNSERNGLLNHPAFLAVHSTLSQSGIVKRGVFTLEQMLCRDIPPPPAGADTQSLPLPIDINPATTSERKLLQISHSSQEACSGCHNMIDPAGFGLENFDAVGRYRLTEKGSVPIDASGALEGIRSYTTSAEFSRALLDSPEMNRCVSQRFLEHYLSQELHSDSCELKKYQTLLKNRANGGSVKDLLQVLISLESFTQRTPSQ